jgi:endopeptidase Clp ATP-binding regulatory subunit ClpX
MKSLKSKIPDQKELEKELNEYLSKKYGDRIKLGVSMLFPKTSSDDIEDGGDEKETKTSGINFDIKPEELESFLNDFVIKQESAKEVLATKVCTHFNRIKYFEDKKNVSQFEGVGQIKNNILMIGPTGVGKTYLIKLIAKKLGVPFSKGDATKFSETGYVGGDVEDLVRDLVHEADGDIDLAQHGIIYVDEIDKIASSHNLIGPDVSRTGVQRALLKPMEETDVDLKVPHDPISLMEAIEQYRKTGKKDKKKINTRNILFIVSGAFYGLEDIIKKRLHAQGIGFSADIRSKDERMEYLRQVRAEDLIEYGFESEFVGRLPVITVFDRLDEEDLYQILKNPQSPIVYSKKKDFQAYGVDIRFEDEALRRIAQGASHEKTGARGLVSAVEKVLMKFEKKLPSTDINRLVVSAELAQDPEKELNDLLADPKDPIWNERYQKCLEEEKIVLRETIEKKEVELKKKYGDIFAEPRIETAIGHVLESGKGLESVFDEILRVHKTVRFYERRFFERFDIRITFGDDALNRIIEKVLQEKVSPNQICENLMKNYEHGLKLIKEKIGHVDFVLPIEAVDDPERYLNRLIQKYYEHLT